MTGELISATAPRVPFLDARTGLVSREWYAFFNALRRQSNATSASGLLTIDDERSQLPDSAQITPVAGELTGVLFDGIYSLGLVDTAVAPATYGSATKLVSITLDAKGRATAAQEYTLNSDNVTEGGANLYFTTARARAAISNGTGITYTAGVIALADTAVTPGTYGSANKSARVTVDQQGRLTAAVEQTITIAAVAGAAPAPDGTYALPTSITIVNGIITAIS